MEDKSFSFWWNQIQVTRVGTLLLPPAVWPCRVTSLQRAGEAGGRAESSLWRPWTPAAHRVVQVCIGRARLHWQCEGNRTSPLCSSPTPCPAQNKINKQKPIRQFPTKGPSTKCLVSTSQNREGHWNYRKSEKWSQLMRLRMAPRVRRTLEKSSGHLNNKVQQYRFRACGKGAALTHDAKVVGSGGWV